MTSVVFTERAQRFLCFNKHDEKELENTELDRDKLSTWMKSFAFIFLGVLGGVTPRNENTACDQCEACKPCEKCIPCIQNPFGPGKSFLRTR